METIVKVFYPLNLAYFLEKTIVFYALKEEKEDMANMRVIMLCAGIGERLRPETYKNNKVLVDINGKTLIEHFLDALTQSGADIHTVHIVIGHYGYKIRKRLGSTYEGLKLLYHVNPLYAVTGAGHSLYVAKHALNMGSTLVLEGDHYLDPVLLKTLVDAPYENAVLVDEDKTRLKYDEEVLAYGLGNNVECFLWPPGLTLPMGELFGEALTIFKLSKDASRALSVILEKYLLETGLAKKEIVEPVNRMIGNYDMGYVPTGNRKWVEIDFQEDLEYARKLKFN